MYNIKLLKTPRQCHRRKPNDFVYSDDFFEMTLKI